jgi:hypothetical protein
LALLAVALLPALVGCVSAESTDTPAPTVFSEPTQMATEEKPTNTAVPTRLEPTSTPVIEDEPTDTPAPSAAGTGTGNADVLFVRAREANDGTWTFEVTVEHPDTGWEDYADGWDVVTPDGKVINPDPESPYTRLLLHPHENEQPFTRSQSGIVIPEDVTQVHVRAHDLVDGWGGRTVVVDLSRDSGPDFEVLRVK